MSAKNRLVATIRDHKRPLLARRFAPRFWPTLITAVLLVVLLTLGIWQLQRLQWKESLLAHIEHNLHAPAVDITALSDGDDYHAAIATGIFDHNHIFYLYGVSLDGLGGYHVLTPLHMADGRQLLVDRGWIPFERKGDAFAKPEGTVTVKGIATKPLPQGWMQPPNNPTKGEWYFIDLPAMGDFLPFVLEAEASTADASLPKAGQTRLSVPNNHLSYALTWFALAAILAVIYLLSSFSKIAED